MGNDKFFQKKRELKEKESKRRQKLRSEHKVILILCEGTKTEPNYFKAFRHFIRLPNESIVVLERYGGSDPLSLVNKAEEEFSKLLGNGSPGYDSVFIVFDRDMHTTYNAAKQRVDELNKKHKDKKDKFEAIVSVPCFEFWLLLHFEDTARPYHTMIGYKSACKCVIDELKEHLPSYEKGNSGIFEKTKQNLDVAVKRAKLLEKNQEAADTDNPSTKVHHLIEYIANL